MSIIFPFDDLLDPAACYQWFAARLWPQGPCCPQCGARDRFHVHSSRRAPLLDYRCPHCRRVFNLFTGTLFAGTHRSLTQLLATLRGVAQGVSTNQLCRELGCGYKHLLELRHKLQGRISAVLLGAGPPPAEAVVEVDEMYQNAGEKRGQAPRPGRSAPPAGQPVQRPRQLGQRPSARGRGGRARHGPGGVARAGAGQRR